MQKIFCQPCAAGGQVEVGPRLAPFEGCQKYISCDEKNILNYKLNEVPDENK